jgi:hypothetical protein
MYTLSRRVYAVFTELVENGLLWKRCPKGQNNGKTRRATFFSAIVCEYSSLACKKSNKPRKCSIEFSSPLLKTSAFPAIFSYYENISRTENIFAPLATAHSKHTPSTSPEKIDFGPKKRMDNIQRNFERKYNQKCHFYLILFFLPLFLRFCGLK